MPKRKPVEAAEPAPAAAEPKKKPVRKTATTPKTTAGKAAHKHHPKKTIEVAVETPVFEVTVPEATPARTVTHEDIARLAYSLWESRGYQGGSPIEDWLRAERELAKLA